VADTPMSRKAMRASRVQWDATETVATVPPQADRLVGITVGLPYFNCGVNAVVVEITREYPVLHTRSSVGWYPVADTAQEAERTLISTIAELDAVIGELAGHRDRLNEELVGLEGRRFLTEPVLRAQS